ncbi:MAG: L-lysine 6-transaminase [Planctomycetota bacterium]
MSLNPGQVHPTLKKWMLADGMSIVADTERSHGNMFVDGISGREYLDLFSFFASGALGFKHSIFDRPDVRNELLEAALIKPTLSDVYHVGQAEFVDEVGKTLPPGFKHLFFIEGGALAVENALKAAFDWKVRKNIQKGRGEKGGQILHFRHAFHGRSGYTLSLTNTHSVAKTQYFPKFPWPRVMSPAMEFPVTPESLAATRRLESDVISEIKRIFHERTHDISAIIIEPIQSEGGDRHFRPEFLKALRDLTIEEDALLIFDEVQTGVGLTGRMWCFEHFGVTPDMFVFGKKMQVCGFASTTKIDEVDSVFKVPSRINSTFGGNLTDMVRAKWILRAIREDRLVENAERMGAHLLDAITSWADSSRGVVGAVRGRGLLMAFDLADSARRDAFRKAAFEQGLLLLSCGDRSIRFRPYLIFDEQALGLLIQLLDRTLKSLA